jgi:hypothetical protein
MFRVPDVLALTVSAGADFRVRAVAGCPAVAPVAGFHGPAGLLLRCRRDDSGWSAGGDG